MNRVSTRRHREKASAASFPLTTSAPARVGRLRGYGNAINAIQAKEFIQAAMGLNV